MVASEDFFTSSGHAGVVEDWTLATPVTGRTVRIEKLGRGRLNSFILSLAEVEVFGRSGAHTLASDSAHHLYDFTEAGTKTVTATHPNGQSGTLTVHVKQADFSDTPQDVVSNFQGKVWLPSYSVDADLYFDGGESLKTARYDRLLHVSSDQRGPGRVAARLHEDGPIVNLKHLNFVGFSDAVQNDMTTSFMSRDFVGYKVISTPIVLTEMPPGGRVDITIFRAGVSFLDGTKKRTLRQEDFVNGIHTLEFLFPQGMAGGYCHRIRIYDRLGRFIGSL